MTFTSNIPAANNNPSADQPLIEGNFTAINNWTLVDHVGFNTSGQGQHLQVFYNATPNYITPPGAPSGNNSILYTQAGGSATQAELYFQNSVSTFLISSIKAFGSFVGTTGSTVNASNMTCVRTSAGRYTITLTANAVTTNNYVVVSGIGQAPSSANRTVLNYQISSPTVILIGTNNASTFVDPDFFSLVVLQL